MSNNSNFITDFSKSDFTVKYQLEFYNYWLKLKGERNMPSRADISPHDIVPILPMIMLFDYLPDTGDFNIRLVGTGCTNFVGEKKNNLEGIESYGESCDRFKWCVKNKKPYFIISTLESINKSHINYSAIVLPLSEDNENVNMIILANHFY